MTIQLLQSRVQVVQDAAALLSAEFGFGDEGSSAAAE